MNVVSLSCRKCGAPLQINEDMEQLACVYCGAQMHVERGGGTISLQLVEALGSIRTGAVQTAAELALVRLEKERNSACYEVNRLESVIEEKSQTRELFKKYIMTENEIALANERKNALESQRQQVNDRGYGFYIISAVILFFVCIFAANYFGSMWWLIPFGIIAIFLMWGLVFLTEDIRWSRQATMGDKASSIGLRLTEHEMAQEATSAIARSRELLPEARAEVARIEEEIVYNKKIVGLKH